MAIYHCSVRTFSRSDNHSAVAASAYRSGSLLKDERTGQSHNYRNRKGIVNALVLLPPHAPAALADRLTLWNAAESAETRKNSRVAREVILALPHELSESQRLSLTKDMALFLVEKYGVAVDMAVHAPLAHHGDDPRNHHAHLLFTTREVKQDGLGAKTRILDDKEQGPVQIELIREVWETLANDALQQAGFDHLRIDRRTLEHQGIDRIPQEHVGKAGTHGDTPADDEDEPRKKDEEDEGDETGTTGKAGSGDKALTPSADKKDTTSSKQKPAAKEKRLDRLTLNEEIKKLNAQRAAFSPTPLKDQIKELDRLMTRLDGRVQRLKLLSQKTSLPERIFSTIVALFQRSKEWLAVRTKDEATRNLSAAERDTKAERQRARYGKTYRASIHERMAYMRENIQILEAKQKQYQRYSAFVELIERRIEIIRPSLEKPVLPAKSEWRTITQPETLRSKIVTEAMQKREKVPIEYRPTLESEPFIKYFKITLAKGFSLLAASNSTKPVTEDFQAAATQPKDNAARAVWHKEVTIKIQSLDKMRAERTPIIMKESMDSSQVWKVEANEKGKIILERMQADIRERKAAIIVPNTSGFSGRFNHPTKIITEYDAIQKIRTEAKVVRAKVPSDFRVEPHTFENSKAATQEARFSNTFKAAGQAVLQVRALKMSTAFNKVSTLDKAENRMRHPELQA